MFDFIFMLMFFAILGAVSYGFYEWLEKIELEKEYLTNLIKEQKAKNNTIKKGSM